ncbi:hypothetical protein B9C88_09600 [Brevibacillus laterosporus]|uniref:XkdQ/YqbQ family protein n=1 Tax=Brevibacillus laterosporus TaxID=1465 RepID=UPI000BC915F0|nr:hypothetical protein [Brevibacillus laterosporus]PCN44460.1 hypothetical protein B9C88_09600 [Brevibacillus laterosporus]
MRVIYGQGSQRIDLSMKVTELSWSSSRGQIAQVCDIKAKESPYLAPAGIMMCFHNQVKEREEFFYGPLVDYEIDDKTGDVSAKAYEISWYLQKNDVSKPYINGDAGKELERIVKAAGISFSCPAFGFKLKDRLSSQSYASLITDLTEKANDKTGRRYFLQAHRNKLELLPEGSNKSVPIFKASLLETSSTGGSLEEVYTSVTVERYKDDKVASSVTKEKQELINKYGRMQKIIDAGEEKDLSSLASKQLEELSEVPKTRSCTIRHNDLTASKIRAGWLIKIMEKDGKTITEWIVTSCNAHWKGEYTMELQLERRG